MKRIDAIKANYGEDKQDPIVLDDEEEIHPWYLIGYKTLEEAMETLEIENDEALEMIYDRNHSEIE